MKARATILGLNLSNPRSTEHPSSRADPAITIGGRMNNILTNVLDMLDGNRKVVVWSNDGVFQGKTYCKEREVAGRIRQMLKISNGTLKIVVEQCP